MGHSNPTQHTAFTQSMWYIHLLHSLLLGGSGCWAQARSVAAWISFLNGSSNNPLPTNILPESIKALLPRVSMCMPWECMCSEKEMGYSFRSSALSLQLHSMSSASWGVFLTWWGGIFCASELQSNCGPLSCLVHMDSTYVPGMNDWTF